mgnify:CR=1 FL=1
MVVLSGTEAKPELQVVGHRPARVYGAVSGVRRGEVCRQELVLRVGEQVHRGHVERDGAHTATETYARANWTLCAASRSKLGVTSAGYPYGESTGARSYNNGVMQKLHSALR